MKDLEGRLSVFELLSVLQMLNNARATGRLRVLNKRNRAAVFFEQGNITFADIANRASRIGDYLLDRGAIERTALDGVLSERNPRRKKLGVRLVELGIVDPEAVREAVEQQIREVVYEVVRWTDGKFAFRAGEKPVGQDILNQVPLDHLMLEGVRRMDEGVA